MLAGDLMVLCIDGKTGRLRTNSTAIENALAGAVLVELVESGRVAFEPNGKKLAVADPTPLNDPVLHEALGRLTKPLRPQSAVERVRKRLWDNVIRQLQDHAVIRVERRRVLGIFPARSYPVVDEAGAEKLRKAVGEVVHGYRGADARTGSLITLLYAVNAVHKVFEGDKREMKKRAKEIARGNWAGDAVRRAVEAIQAGVTAAASAAASGE
ncbi:GPP34 family phosphoprotein [Lentzea sp. NPDC003310]|uniref:GOLPH3/VPS74 family protein n=1 Tax=Lentzea sp. NPDC003310 TaxID=3154447 RepID=UPI0033B51A60